MKKNDYKYKCKMCENNFSSNDSLMGCLIECPHCNFEGIVESEQLIKEKKTTKLSNRRRQRTPQKLTNHKRPIVLLLLFTACLFYSKKYYPAGNDPGPNGNKLIQVEHNPPSYLYKKRIFQNFDLAPSISSTERPIKRQSNHKRSLNFMPLFPTENESFQFECQIDIQKLVHYSPIHIGLENKRLKSFIKLEIGRRDEFYFKAHLASPSKENPIVKIDSFKDVLAYQIFHVKIVYSAIEKQVEITILNKDKQLMSQFIFEDISSLFVNSLSIEVLKRDGVGTVFFDSKEKNLFVRSVHSGIYYSQLTIDNLSLKSTGVSPYE